MASSAPAAGVPRAHRCSSLHSQPRIIPSGWVYAKAIQFAILRMHHLDRLNAALLELCRAWESIQESDWH